MNNYFHSVRLIANRCQGCDNCIKRCPTEAIRIRSGQARITEARCIDCGECIRRCPSHAKTAVTDSLADLQNFRYNIALPAPSLYAQFSLEYSIERILCGLLNIGFDEVFEKNCCCFRKSHPMQTNWCCRGRIGSATRARSFNSVARYG